MPRRKLAPAVQRMHLTLKSKLLHHQSKIIEHKEGQRAVKEQINRLAVPKPKE